jgi:hypothetical protein
MDYVTDGQKTPMQERGNNEQGQENGIYPKAFLVLVLLQ